MSIIEKAVERLEQLQRAAGNGDTVERLEPIGQEPTATTTAIQTPAPTPAAVEQTAPAPDVSRVQNPDRFVDIDLDRLHSIEIVTPNAPRSLIGDEFRIVKRPLLRNVQGKRAAEVKNANLIMVTSSPGL